MTVGSLVELVQGILERRTAPHARAEARDLVAAIARRPRFWPRTDADRTATPELTARAIAAARRRAAGAPFAYAVGRAAFRHLTLEVDERVLIPRQETEVLVDLILRRRGATPGGVAADVGTGSGAIALALATEGRFDRIIACDVATDALGVARRNAAALAPATRHVELRAGDLLLPLAGERLDVVASNPPYIAYDEARELPEGVRNWEPPLALLSGGEGLDATRRLVTGAPVLLCSGGLLALEVDTRRALPVAELIASQGDFEDVTVHQDLTGRDRFVLASRR